MFPLQFLLPTSSTAFYLVKSLFIKEKGSAGTDPKKQYSSKNQNYVGKSNPKSFYMQKKH
jgi:hypothetical protein